MRIAILAAVCCAATSASARTLQEGTAVQGWLSWRGPLQSGVSLETGLFDEVELGGKNHLWSYELAGRGTPVIASGRVYALGYEGSDADLQEMLVCLDERSGELVWERRWSDFLTDSIYERYALGSPAVDPDTGNVYVVSTAGRLMAFTRDGAALWERSLMEEFGRLTFPNGRTGAPVIDGELAIFHTITGHWGPVDGPARDRFYAFDKRDGRHVWTSTPGGPPVDGPYSHPVLEWRGGRRLAYAGTGCGFIVCVDARTGDPIWRFPFTLGGVCASTLLQGDALIAVHGLENRDSSVIGRMVALGLGAEPEAGTPGPVVLGADHELWRNDLVSFSSSPVLAGGRVYLTTQTGELACVDPADGRILWQEKLAPDQVHASPVWADGKLYVPMNNGSFHVVRPSDEGLERLCSVELEGDCLGAPAVCNGRVYVHTTRRLYCFGTGEGEYVGPTAADEPPAAADPTRLLVRPGDVLLRQGDEALYDVSAVDEWGGSLHPPRAAYTLTGARFQPPAHLGLRFDAERSVLVAPADARPGIGLMQVAHGDEGDALRGSARIRVVPALPWSMDFEELALAQSHAGEEPVPYEFPPAHWIGARLKWEVRELEGSKVLAKTLDNPLFQRSTAFMGHPDDSGYTIQADIRTDGTRRSMSSAGLICQRYLFELKGNHQQLAVSSNVERLNVSVPFAWRPGEWITLKARVDRDPDGTGVARAKAWRRGEPEPDEWTLAVELRHVHANGSPGIYSFAPQSRFHVYLDNLSVTPND